MSYQVCEGSALFSVTSQPASETSESYGPPFFSRCALTSVICNEEMTYP